MLFWVAHITAGWLFADLLSGMFHWIEDRYLDPNWPIIGEYVAKPNLVHHIKPTQFLEVGYWTRNWTTIVPSIIVTSIASWLHAPLWMLIGFACVSQANEIHAWAHRRVQSRIIRGLQEFGVLQSCRHHNVHHKTPFNVHYCAMTDYLNGPLERLGFWRGLEFVLACFGVKPRRDDDHEGLRPQATQYLPLSKMATSSKV
ncbi:MAG: fatty acid desaturase CarF family protein [Pirellulales bacterium]